MDANHAAEAPNMLHQLGSPTTAWTTVNTAEVVPSVLTPLGASCFWADVTELELRRGYAEMGIISPKDVRIPATVDERMVAVVFGHPAANVDRLRDIADSMPGTSGDALEAQYFGSVRAGVTSNPSRRRYPVLAIKMPGAAMRLPRRMIEARRETDLWWRRTTFSAPPRSRSEAVGALVSASERFRTVLCLHIQATALAQATYEQVGLLAGAAGREGLELRLTTGYGDLEETKMLKDIWEISRGRLSMDDFIGRHGFHGPGEGEPSNPSWRHNPKLVEFVVSSYRGRDESQSPAAIERRRTAERKAAEAELLGSLGRAKRLTAPLVLKLAGKYIRLKEVGKTAYVQAIDGGRFAAHVLGEQLAQSGVLRDPSDVFFLTLDELRSGQPEDPRPLVEERREIVEYYRGLTLPPQWVGVPEPIETGDAVSPGDPPSSIRGVPVSPGVVEGRVHVVLDPNEADDFPEGGVLACELTDPSWMPLLSLAAAVVIDKGGPLSHCAIAARELGIPAVVNTLTGTKTLKTGDRVRVDAAAGVVEILERTKR